MGNNSSLLLHEEEISQLKDDTGFTPKQIERLYSRFTSLDHNDCGTLGRDDFSRIPELAINPLGERIIDSFFQNHESDRVNFREFLGVLAHFRPLKKNKENKVNSLEDKLRYAFDLYDLDNDDMISHEDLRSILHMMVGTHLTEEQVTSIVKRTIPNYESESAPKISFEQFCKAFANVGVEHKMSIKFLN